MGLSEGEGGGIVGECGVGTIVWVRRRNGSWWPGRILGQEELSASHLMSPRSGTPVKLLGREDASVDWYNLEKSKRVKAFRCGEFDACIERAEASRGIPIKKREKYARREDAILHALELEKQMLERKQQKLGSSSSNKFPTTSKKEQTVGFPSGNHIQNNDSADHGRSVPKPQLLSRKVSSPPEASMVNPFYTQKGKGGKYSTWEDDTSEATPRMRGLQDFGLRSAQSKRKATATVSNESAHRPFLIDSHVHGIPVPVQGIEGATNVMTSKNGSSLKKRRNQGGVNEESLGKRRDRRRPLVQVLQSSAKLPASQSFLSTCSPIPIHMKEGNYQTFNLLKAGRSAEDNLPDDSNDCLDHTGYSSDQMQTSPILCRYPGNLVEENTSSGLNEADESNSSGEDDSDEDADTEDDETLYTGIAQSLAPLSKNSGRYIEDDSLMSFADQERYGNLDGIDEPLLSRYMYPQNPHEQTVGTSADLGVSKWNMKGKRNIRNLTKRPMEGMDGMVGDIYHGSINGRSYESKRRTLKSSRARTIGEGFYQKYDDFDENDFIEKDLDPQLPRYGNHRYSSMLKGSSRNHRDSGINDSDEDSPGMSPSGWEGDGVQHVTKRAYWETEGDHFDQFYAGHLGVGMESMLVDVDLKVQASYQGERVPLVSLMSRLNGKAIVGHPVQIETLDDGSTNALISRNDSGEDPAADGNETPPPVWRTARRTAMQRVPRPHPLPAALEGREGDALLYSDPEMKPTFKKPYAVHFDNQAKLAKKTSHGHRPVMPVKFQKKASKKVSLSNQKTRKLSSIATQQKLGRVQAVDGKLTSKGGGSILDGLIKPGSSVPMVTCVPVKVVFSRILEAVGRSPLTAVTNRSPMSGPSQKKPS